MDPNYGFAASDSRGVAPPRKDECDEPHQLSDRPPRGRGGRPPRSRPPQPPPSAFIATAAKNGGTLVVGLTAGEPDALDPTLARTFSGREVFLTFCEKLYDLNAKAQIVPQLASALPTISKDKLTVTIPLRTGIKFNDGTPFNAAAVVKTLQRDQTLKGSARASEISPISRSRRPAPRRS